MPFHLGGKLKRLEALGRKGLEDIKKFFGSGFLTIGSRGTIYVKYFDYFLLDCNRQQRSEAW